MIKHAIKHLWCAWLLFISLYLNPSILSSCWSLPWSIHILQKSRCASTLRYLYHLLIHETHHTSVHLFICHVASSSHCPADTHLSKHSKFFWSPSVHISIHYVILQKLFLISTKYSELRLGEYPIVKSSHSWDSGTCSGDFCDHFCGRGSKISE